MSYYYSQVYRRFQPSNLRITGPLKQLATKVKSNKLIICGESHGVRENADLAYSLCKQLGITQLAIERPASLFQPFIKSVIDGQPNWLLPNVLPSLQASALSIEMLKTITCLLNEGCVTNIKFVDIDPASMPSLDEDNQVEFMKVREQEIARHILALDPAKPTLVILGNYHTRTDGSTPASALSLVRKKRKATHVEYEYRSGEQYNAGRILRFSDKGTSKNSNDYALSHTSNDDFSLQIRRAHRILV